MTTQSPMMSSLPFAPVASSVAAYEACKAEIEAATRDAVAPNVDVAHAVRVMLTVAGNVQKYLPELLALGLKDVDKLALRANALSYAQALHDWTLNAPPKVEALAQQVTAARRLLTSELELMVLRGVIAEGAVSLQTTNGYLGTAQDVRAICSAFLANWEKVGPQIGNEQAHVHAGLHAADSLIAGLAKAAEIQEKLKGTALMRAAAWKLAFASYREIDRGIGFLRYYEGDAEVIVPSLYDHSRARRRSPEKPEATPANGAPAQPAQPMASPGAAMPAAQPNQPVTPITPSKSFE